MTHRFAMASIAAATLTAAAVFANTASAGNVGWSVSVGVPGIAVTAGAPAYWGGGAVVSPAYRYGYRPYYRPYYRPSYRAWGPVVYPAPVIAYPYPAPVIVPRPVVVRAPAIAMYP